jgi:hypothetical protein
MSQTKTNYFGENVSSRDEGSMGLRKMSGKRTRAGKRKAVEARVAGPRQCSKFFAFDRHDDKSA